MCKLRLQGDQGPIHRLGLELWVLIDDQAQCARRVHECARLDYEANVLMHENVVAQFNALDVEVDDLEVGRGLHS